MTNWRNIDITTDDGRQLLRLAVADKLGWTETRLRGGWGGLQLWGIPPAGGIPEQVPQFADDLATAITLSHEGAHLNLIIRENDGAVIAAYIQQGGYRRMSAKSSFAAAAVCLAWLGFEESTDES